MSEKLVVTVTAGPDDPEKATFAFIMANTALIMEMDVTMIFQSNGIYNVTKGTYEHIKAVDHESIKEHVENFIENGGKLLACIPACISKEIPKDQLIDGVQMIKAGRALKEMMEADLVLNY
ncbi:DsrE family protein [Thermodesulfobium narugense DSM 14796]|uniref:DsrE family protein n=1 Tax=Thermodesulfobium narugense DSM 14796 TaxID=747365 RepID=M1E8S8_9BACT|nr:DsrE family protein [Thermodesulfobium narugense]AEE15140.1 DsrE family protein [Thermodesulfobium narugense DSM 14796]